MHNAVRLRPALAFLPLLLSSPAIATTIARLSLDQMTARSEMIVSGTISDSFTAWDVEHKYIWTHYIVTVDNAVKGAVARTVEIAEPGGVVGIVAMNIGGATGYRKGENVLIFLERMPNGYLRTAALGQGKYGIDAQGRLHGLTLKDVDLVAGASSPIGVQSLDGMPLTEAVSRIAARVRFTARGLR